jgi:hypothetical protein
VQKGLSVVCAVQQLRLHLDVSLQAPEHMGHRVIFGAQGQMRVVCCQDGIDFSVSESDLSRSPLVPDFHSLDPEGCAELQCGSIT